MNILYVDASVKNGVAGVGITDGKEFNVRYTFPMDSSFEAEKMGIVITINYLQSRGIKTNEVTLYTDCQSAYNLVKDIRLGINLQWISRDYNLAHDIANEARLGLNGTKQYKNFLALERLNKAIDDAKKLRREEKTMKARMEQRVMAQLRAELYPMALQQLKEELREQVEKELTEKLVKELKEEILAELKDTVTV